MSTFYKYTGTLFGNNSNVAVLGGIKKGHCPFNNFSLPTWSGLVSNNDVSRAVLPGRPTVVTEKPPGGCFDYFDGVIPELHLELSNVNRKTPGTRKEFEAAKAAGKIVLKPIIRQSISADFVAGTSNTSTLHKDAVQAVMPSAAPSALEETNPCNGYFEPGYGYVESIGGFPLDFPLRSAGYSVSAHRQYDVISVGSLTLPPEKLAYEAYHKVLGVLALPVDKGLVTSTVATANSGILDILTEIGEAKETITYVFGMLRSIVQLVVRVKRDVLRARKRPGATAANIADEVASIWLQFRYAVMPISYTIEDSLELLQSQFSPYATTRQGKETSHSIELSDGWVCSDLKVVDRCFVKYRYKAEIASRGMKMNPLATAWELTFLSFVVDWVLNIGDLLSALSTPSGVVDSGIQVSRQVKEQTLVIHKPGTREGHINLHVRHYDARPTIASAHIGLTVDLDMSWKRWLDAISLSWGMTRSLLKG